MSITSRSVSWSRDSEAELRRLLEACRGNPVLESQLKERIEDAEDARDAKAAIDEGGYVPYDEFRKTLKKENDVDDELDLSKPCEVRTDDTGDEWVLVLREPYIIEEKGEKWYGCYVKCEFAIHIWCRRSEIRNILSPKYESHNMESLLPLAGEWVRANESDVVVRIGSMTPKSVWMMGFRPSEWTYDELKTVFTWATGPYNGKPVAREVG